MKDLTIGRILTRAESKMLVGGSFTPVCGDECSDSYKCPSTGKCSVCKSGKCIEKTDEETY